MEKIEEIKPIDQLTNPQVAIRQYHTFMQEFQGVIQFIYTFRKRLEDLYFVKTDIYSLSLPETLHKRHLVFSLFSVKAEK
jgi:hypothetical protein